MIGILIIAHAPLASALRECALHVFPDCAAGLQALDIAPNASPEDSLHLAREAMNTTLLETRLHIRMMLVVREEKMWKDPGRRI